MHTRSNGLTYTHPGDIRAARVNYGGAYGTADRKGQRNRSRAVTPYMVTLEDGRERRVYAAQTKDGTQAMPFVSVRGEDVMLDARTEDALAQMHASGEPFKVLRPHAELVSDMIAEILDDVRDGTVPASVTDYSELHDYTDANTYGWREEDEGEDFDSSTVGPAQDDVHAWLQSGGILAAAGNPELVADDRTNDEVWGMFGDGLGESVGDMGDGDPFWAGITWDDNGQWFGAIESTLGQRTVYRFASEESASVWLATQRARLVAVPVEEWPL